MDLFFFLVCLSTLPQAFRLPCFAVLEDVIWICCGSVQDKRCDGSMALLLEWLGNNVDNRKDVIWKCNFLFFSNHFSITPSHLACKWLAIKNSLEIGSAHSKFYGPMLMSKTQIGSSKFHVVDKTTTAVICIKTWNSRSKRAKVLCFVVKYANLLFPCSRGGGGGRLIFLWIVNLFIGWLPCWFLISQLFLRNWLVWKALN